MGDAPETPPNPRQRLEKTYEDPHYHDEDETPSDDVERPTRPPPSHGKPGRRIPPPPRRHYED